MLQVSFVQLMYTYVEVFLIDFMLYVIWFFSEGAVYLISIALCMSKIFELSLLFMGNDNVTADFSFHR